MGASRVTPARALALSVCAQVRRRDAFAHELLDAALADAHLTLQDAAFARTLVLGCVATRGTLDELIDGVLKSPKDIEDTVRDALRISAYELFFLDHPAHAVVDQGVELAASARPRARGVANFALRRLAEKQADFPFGDPVRDTAALSRAAGFPLWLTELAKARYGDMRAARFLAVSNDPAPVFFTVNALRASDEEVFAALEAAGIAHEQGWIADESFGKLPVAFSRVLLHAADVASETFAALIREGKVIVSDAAAQAVASLALPREAPASMLEVGAGRGTKTLLLQSLAQRTFGWQIPLTCIDYLDFKADLLTARLKAAGITDTEVLVADGADLDATFGGRSFGAIFIDAPCSGLGTLRRHPEIRWRLTPEDITSLADVGKRMLGSAATHLAPGGRLTYSSCTITPEETTELIRDFAESPAARGLEAIPHDGEGAPCFASLLSHGSGDAHFAAAFRRIG